MSTDAVSGWVLPKYTPPDFKRPELAARRAVQTIAAPADGVLPDNYHATSNHPEYLHFDNGDWLLVPKSRMDAVLILRDRAIEVLEPRRVKCGDPIVVGRSENGEEGIYIHTTGFKSEAVSADKFAFRTHSSRESPFSRSYDELYQVLHHDRDYGHIVWVLGPAVAFDQDSRTAMQKLISHGYCHALMAGNALAVHDLEAALYGTGLGQDIYNQTIRPQGHYNHLDTINKVCVAGSIPEALNRYSIDNGIIYACEQHKTPYLLAGSIRDDGPLPGVITDVTKAQNAMRNHACRATTVLALATQLHAIAFGNMVPNYRVLSDGVIRPVYFYIVDMSEFGTGKLSNRGTAQANVFLTNVQDFLVNLWHNLGQE